MIVRSDSPGSPSVWWFVALAAALVLASSVRLPDVSGVVRFGHFDKIVHFLMFGLLATLAARLRWVQAQRPFGIYTAIIIVSLFGATDEWHQQFTAGRSVELADWIVDTLGAAVAVVLYTRWRSYRHMLERPVWGRVNRRVEIVSKPCLIATDGFRRSLETDRSPAPADRAA